LRVGYPSSHRDLVSSMERVELIVSSLRKRYGRKVVLNGITFRASGGSCIAVVGPNGVGKTTLLKCLCGLLQPSSGEALLLIGEMTLTPTEAQPFIGALLDDCEPYDELTVRENLNLLLSLKLSHGWHIQNASEKQHGRSARSQVEWLLREFQLIECADELVCSLSSGMRQRLKLAMACVSEPLLLLLDEPMVNLDWVGRAAVESAVCEMRNKGSIVVWATCDAGEVKDATAVINLGEAEHNPAREGLKD